MDADRFLQISFTLLPYCKSRGRLAKDEVCHRFSLTNAELMEWLDAVMMCGIPDYGPDRMIDFIDYGQDFEILFADYVNRPLRMTLKEASRVVLALKIWSCTGAALEETIESLRGKILQAIGHEQGQELDKALAIVTADIGTTHLRRSLELIRDAMTARKPISLRYRSKDGSATSRIIEPLSIAYSGSFWYMEAFCRLRMCDRTFRIDRMENIKILEEDACIRQPAIGGSMAENLARAPLAHEITLEGTKDALEVIATRFFAKMTAKKGSKNHRIVFKVDDLDWLACELLPWADHVNHIRPKELHDRIIAHIDEIIKIYQ